MRVAMMIFIGLFLASPASAENMRAFKTAKTLYNECTGVEEWSPLHAQFQGYCRNYILGVFDLLMMAEVFYETPDFCPPEGVKAVEVRDVAVQFLEENKDGFEYPAPILIKMAFIEEWPCED